METRSILFFAPGRSDASFSRKTSLNIGGVGGLGGVGGFGFFFLCSLGFFFARAGIFFSLFFDLLTPFLSTMSTKLWFLHCWMGSPALPAVDTGILAELKFFD